MIIQWTLDSSTNETYKRLLVVLIQFGVAKTHTHTHTHTHKFSCSTHLRLQFLEKLNLPRHKEHFLTWISECYIFLDFSFEKNWRAISCCFSVTKSCPILRSHGLQHAWFLCLPLSLGVSSNSCPLSQWCYLTISSYAIPFICCLPSFPASGSLPMSCLCTSGGQSIGASASASVFPKSI